MIESRLKKPVLRIGEVEVCTLSLPLWEKKSYKIIHRWR